MPTSSRRCRIEGEVDRRELKTERIKDNAETRRAQRDAENEPRRERIPLIRSLPKLQKTPVRCRRYLVGTTGFVAGALAGADVAGAESGAARAACTVGEILSAFASNWLTCHN